MVQTYLVFADRLVQCLDSFVKNIIVNSEVSSVLDVVVHTEQIHKVALVDRWLLVRREL